MGGPPGSCAGLEPGRGVPNGWGEDWKRSPGRTVLWGASAAASDAGRLSAREEMIFLSAL